MKFQLSIIVPTFNEVDNVILLYKEIQKHLNNKKYEVVFVDDNSQDGTVEKINTLIAKYDNVRLIKRINKRGLSSACIDGFSSCVSDYLAVIDADLQHDPQNLPKMLEVIEKNTNDIVIASRFIHGAKITGLSLVREKLSNVGNNLSSLITGAKLTDPLSGYFMIRCEMVDKIINRLSGKGFKILLDIFSTCKINKINITFQEIPSHFRQRQYGKSKLDSLVMLEFLLLFCDKLLGKHISVRFALFILVGLSGLVLHMLLLTIMVQIFQIDFTISQAIATYIAMASNFFINNVLTYRDRKLHGIKLLKGLLTFFIACTFGAIINIIIATFLFEKGIIWLLAGFVGCVVGSIWNYTTTAFFTWKKK